MAASGEYASCHLTAALFANLTAPSTASLVNISWLFIVLIFNFFTSPSKSIDVETINNTVNTFLNSGGLNVQGSAVVANSTGVFTTLTATTSNQTNETVSGTLTASGTVTGSGFSNYLASPPAIGGTTANAGTFTTVTATSGISGGTF